MKTGKEISEKDLYFSSSIDLGDLVSSLAEGGKQITPEPHPIPIRKAITLQASVCKHHYPVSPQSRAHRDYVCGEYTAPLCPHCDIAAPSTSSSSSSSSLEEQETEGAKGQTTTTTITATDCGHPITVRHRTAAIIAANPLIFSPSPDDEDDGDSDKEERSHNDDVWPGYTRCSSPHSLTLPPHERKPVRVNLNVRRCVACVKREQASALRLVTRARAELRKLDDANADDDDTLLGARAAAAAGSEDVAGDRELEELWAGRVCHWRRKCVQLRLGLEVLEQERERAEGEGEGEERGEGGVDGRQLRVNGDASTKKRRESTGSLRNLKSLSTRSARSVSWRGARGERWRDSALKPALKKSTKADVDAEDVVKKGLGVHFDSKSGAFGNEFRSPARFERKSTYYRPGKWARDGLLLDTSGFSLTTEKEIKEWHIPPNGFTVSPDNDEKVEKTWEMAKRIVEKSQALGWL
ncbi:uncharacterized protein LTHEOB_1410 [Lasiodiplodia theobromae]|uniref:uncharacterized protein n=1 Tax=Lasiodiplodia theobromae TaxID=45133 RepID=UPI0015C40346|nr:uncharacterized protein LTHEOB_1410 [Lasiodiplodia theobromae]KAF4537219.1 hypothetical protein LTHEOB_1410 [Lasiodiplodia theobromae]